MKRRILLTLLLVGLLPALACNLPVRGTAAINTSAAQTLTARPPVQPGADGSEVDAGPTLEPALPIVTVVGGPEVNPDANNATSGIVTPFPIPSSASRLEGNTFYYITQPGDRLAALALRFGIDLNRIPNPQQFPPEQFLPSGQQLAIPNTLANFDAGGLLMPDSEIVYSPASLDFSVEAYVRQAGGYLNTYTEVVDGKTVTGAQIVQRVANETSINPRLLLAFLDYRSHWVTGAPVEIHANPYPIGFGATTYAGLYKEITLTARQLTLGYYGWRSGQAVTLTFLDHKTRRMNPIINAGTAALQTLFAVLYDPDGWRSQLYSPASFMAFYNQMMGDPWQRAAAMGPLIPDHLAQPPLELPFAPGMSWSFTGGPHAAWGVGSPWGALDFAPANVEKGCTVSRFWATAVAPGLVVRSGDAQVLLDLDGDGHEQTGWVVLYLHMAGADRVPVGAQVNLDDRIGHPSCEGGVSTGTHVHISRKYNGEWLSADGPLPFVLSGWQARSGQYAYSGALSKAGQTVTARPDGAATSLVAR